jgi:hypothetical protein
MEVLRSAAGTGALGYCTPEMATVMFFIGLSGLVGLVWWGGAG